MKIMGAEQFGLIIVGVLTLFGTIVSSWLAYAARSQAAQANSAVNKRPDGSPKLYDLVLLNQEKTYEIASDMIRLKGSMEELKFKVGNIEKHCPMCISDEEK